MEQIITKQEFSELMKIEGEARGAGVKGEMKFILEEEGAEGLKKLEDTITKLGYPLSHKRIRGMSFYPIGLEAVVLLAIKRLFNYDDKKFQRMGKRLAKYPLIVRLFINYFSSSEEALIKNLKMWRKAFTIGKLKVVEFDLKERHVIVRLENFKVHPLFCQVFIGSITSTLELFTKTKIACEEVKCVFRGDLYHEFLFKER